MRQSFSCLFGARKVARAFGSGSLEPVMGPFTTGQRDPEVFVWPIVFLEAWGTSAKKRHVF